MMLDTQPLLPDCQIRQLCLIMGLDLAIQAELLNRKLFRMLLTPTYLTTFQAIKHRFTSNIEGKFNKNQVSETGFLKPGFLALAE